ncbi:MAG: BlaI/MecI/CopY family transcriptional regulator [Candidatus Latescibacteria bacterium]|nr:BlaI/MecI/CopY family transcriptional regulator [Candidatus Latescibacterota bacterium]
MARPKSPTLTEAELRLMDVLWKKEAATVSDVVAALPHNEPLAYSTVLTTLRILERKGYVSHEKEGRAYVYQPVVGREDARRSVVRYMMSRFFNNSAETLVLNILENEAVDPEVLKRMKQMVDDSG